MAEFVFVVIYRSPYPEDGGEVSIEGITRDEGAAYQLARERVKAVSRMAPITALDDYSVERHELQ